MCGHMKSFDAHDKLIQTRSHERDRAASRKRQVVMRKVKSTVAATSGLETRHIIYQRRIQPVRLGRAISVIFDLDQLSCQLFQPPVGSNTDVGETQTRTRAWPH